MRRPSLRRGFRSRDDEKVVPPAKKKKKKFTAKSNLYGVDPMKIESVGSHGDWETITVLSDIQAQSYLLLLEKESER